MIALLLAIVVSTGHVQGCGAYGEAGPNVGHVVWWGSESADLSPIGAGDCTGTAWAFGAEVSR